MRRTQPAAYLKILALLVPREHKVEQSNVIKNLSDQELEAMVEYLKTSLEAQARGSVRVIEGTIEPAAATTRPVIESPQRKNRLMLEADTAVGPLGFPEALDEPVETNGTDWPAALGNEYVAAFGVIAA